MTTQPETPVVERVSRIEGIVEQVNLRLAENHDDIQALSAKIDAQGAKIDAQGEALSAKIDAQGEALRAEIREGDAALSAKIDAQGRELNAKIDAQGREFRAETQALNEKIDRLRSEMHRQTVLVVGLLGGLMALLRFVG